MLNNVPKSLNHKEILKCIPKGKYLGNFRCHENCLSYALRHPTKVSSIIGVAQVFNDNTACAHFILKMKDSTYFDPTYGNMSSILDSYHIRIEEYTIDTFNPNRELQNLKDYLFSLRPWYIRTFFSNPY